MTDPQKRTVTEVRRMDDSAKDPVWLVRVDVEGALPWIYAFPHVALVYRSAEYGIDPADADTLLDVVIHESHFELSHTDPTFLYNTDEKTALAAHLARVADAKTRVAISDPDNHLDVIRKHHDSNDPRLDGMRSRVRAMRSANISGRNRNG